MAAALQAFRNGVNSLGQERPYQRGVTECIGVLNLANGASQYAVGRFMKNKVVSKLHIERGEKAWKLGLQQTEGLRTGLKKIAPVAIVGGAAAMYYYSRNWICLSCLMGQSPGFEPVFKP